MSLADPILESYYLIYPEHAFYQEQKEEIPESVTLTLKAGAYVWVRDCTLVFSPAGQTGKEDSARFDELSARREAILAEILSRKEYQEVTVPNGTYQAGVDFPAGVWRISATSDTDLAVIDWGYELSSNGNVKHDRRSSQWIYHNQTIPDAYDSASIVLRLELDMYISPFCPDTPVVFSTYTGAPDITFEKYTLGFQ